jgi:large subunit ribosomal protein L15
MPEKKKTKKAPARRPAAMKPAAKPRAKKTPAKSATTPVREKTPKVSAAHRIAQARPGGMGLGAVKPAAGSRPKRQRIGRGHGSGMVKTGGEGGKGQTVRSGGGKGRHFEGGQTPWARRLPHRRGYSQKARDIGHFRSRYAVVNLHRLSKWDSAVVVSPETLRERGIIKSFEDGVKILGGSKSGQTLPSGLQFRDVVFSRTAREALEAAGAHLDSLELHAQ